MPTRMLMVWMLLVQPCNTLGKTVLIKGSRSLDRGVWLQLMMDRLTLALALVSDQHPVQSGQPALQRSALGFVLPSCLPVSHIFSANQTLLE